MLRYLIASLPFGCTKWLYIYVFRKKPQVTILALKNLVLFFRLLNYVQLFFISQECP